METFQDYQRELLAGRLRRYRKAQRAAGLRPFQIWVTDTDVAGFAAECKRQCQVLAASLQARRSPCRRWISLQRGDLVTLEAGRRSVRAPAAPQHALVLQHDLFLRCGCVAILPVTGQHLGAPLLRVSLGLDRYALIDQLQSVPRRAIQMVYGAIDARSQREVDRALVLYLGLVR